MSTVIVTLLLPDQGVQDLELPDQVPVRRLIPALVSALQLPETSASGAQVVYELARHGDGQFYVLRPTDTLASAGVLTGGYLALTSTLTQSSGIRTAAADPIVASLQCMSGQVIVLDNSGKRELTLGRYDARTGQTPDIELSGEPEGNTVSRQHALLRKQGSQWALAAVAQGNLITVNDVPLLPGQVRVLTSGDCILLGRVRLIFEAS